MLIWTTGTMRRNSTEMEDIAAVAGASVCRAVGVGVGVGVRSGTKQPSKVFFNSKPGEGRSLAPPRGHRFDPYPFQMGRAPGSPWNQARLIMEMTHEESSGNVFADAGLPDPGQELVKAKLTAIKYRETENSRGPRRRG
jgi:hypothetical protein